MTSNNRQDEIIKLLQEIVDLLKKGLDAETVYDYGDGRAVIAKGRFKE